GFASSPVCLRQSNLLSMYLSVLSSSISLDGSESPPNKLTLMDGFFDVPSLDVTNRTPFAALDPYMAVELASFKTSMLLISLGLISDKPPLKIIPSKTINGSLPPLREVLPLISKSPPCPGRPSPVNVIPGTLSRDWAILVLGIPLLTFATSTDETAPVILRSACSPYPTTTNSSSSKIWDCSFILISVLPFIATF